MKKEKNPQTFKENQTARGKEANKIRKIVFIVISVAVLILVIGGIFGYNYVTSALEPVDETSDKEIEFEIPIGSSTSDIGAILEENGLIKDKRFFQIYTKLNNDVDFQAGTYTFTPSMTLNEIVRSLNSGRVELTPVKRVTIPEGLTVEEIAEVYADSFSFSTDEFLEKTKDEEYVSELIESYPLMLSDKVLDEDIRNPLEGYLYAITYDFFDEDPSIESIIEMMLDQTQSVLAQYEEEIEQLDMSIHELLTFASVVEKETGTVEQRDEIAGVFYNRLEEDMRLQTDPTVLYALGEHKDRVLYEDLEVESPYNTYKVKGLPVGPISNFGERSLDAVLKPAQNSYLYFLHDSEGDIYYAETYDEHNENIEAYMDN